jgi:hypothetical protein
MRSGPRGHSAAGDASAGAARTSQFRQLPLRLLQGRLHLLVLLLLLGEQGVQLLVVGIESRGTRLHAAILAHRRRRGLPHGVRTGLHVERTIGAAGERNSRESDEHQQAHSASTLPHGFGPEMQVDVVLRETGESRATGLYRTSQTVARRVTRWDGAELQKLQSLVLEQVSNLLVRSGSCRQIGNPHHSSAQWCCR